MSIPYIPQGTSRRFKVPRTLAADFTSFLNQDIPNTVMDFTLLKDWYAQFEGDYEPNFIRGEIYADSTKSRYTNTDNNMNFRADVNSGIQKGDMLIQPDGTIFLLDWEVALESNNAPSRALRCNAKITVTRYQIDEVDEDGYVSTYDYEDVDEWGYAISEDSDQTNESESFTNTHIVVADSIPVNAYRYDGRPEYPSISGTPGVTPTALTIMSLQYNSKTKNIRINDQFIWGFETYRVIDIDRMGMNINGQRGVLRLQCNKVAGGMYEPV